MSIVGILISIIILGSAVVFVAFGLRYSRMTQDEEIDPVMARLAEATRRGEAVSLEDSELQQPFSERIILPLMQKVGEISIRFTPQKLLQEITLKLEQAGNPGRIDVATFLATRFVGATIFGGGLLMISLLSGTQWPLGTTVLVVGLFTIIGFFFPQLWLQSRINRRQNEVRKLLPETLDLLAICDEAGLGFDTAMSKVAETGKNELSLIFGRTIREVQLGKTQRQALRDMVDRIGLPELASLIEAVIQSQALGVSLAKLLRIHSDDIYTKHKERVLNEITTIDNWNIALFFILFGPIFILWFTWPMLAQILSAYPK